MQTSGFAKFRSLFLLSLAVMAVLTSGSAHAADKVLTTSNINRSHNAADVALDSDKSGSESASDRIDSPDTAADASNSGSADNTAAPADSGAPQNLSASGATQLAAADSAPPAMSEPGVSGDALASFGPSSGTVVGNRALELRDEVLRLRSSVNLNAGQFSLLRANGAAGAVQYHSTVAAITARLQNGTTRGNPILLRQWDEAEASLNEVTNSLDRLNALQTSVSADASLSSYLLESVQAAFQLSGAVDEDHDQLKLLRDEVSRMIVQLDYLRNQVADDIQRQTTYLTTERTNLQTLAFAISRGELLGNSLGNRPVIVNPMPVVTIPQGEAQQSNAAPIPEAAPTTPVMPGQIGPPPMSPRTYMQESGQSSAQQLTAPAKAAENLAQPSLGHLLVLIRYNQPNVPYEQQLSRAVGATLQKQPDATFSVVAVSPATGDPSDLAKEQEQAGRNAESVKRSLIQLGLAPARISVANTQAPSAQMPEVHVYVR